MLGKDGLHVGIFDVVNGLLSHLIFDSRIRAVRKQQIGNWIAAAALFAVAGAPVLVTARCNGVEFVFLSTAFTSAP